MIMARSFRIFILLIKVNKMFPFFRRRILFVRVSIEIRYKSTSVINLLAFFHEFVLEYEYDFPNIEPATLPDSSLYVASVRVGSSTQI